MSEVIKTDFVLGKLDGFRYEPLAELIARELRRCSTIDHIPVTATELLGSKNAMLFGTITALFGKVFAGLEYELATLYYEITVFAERSTGTFLTLVIMLGDCRLGEVPRISFDVGLDLEGKGEPFKKLCESTEFEFKPIVSVVAEGDSWELVDKGWLRRWRPASVNKIIANLRDLAEISTNFTYSYNNTEPRDDTSAEYAVEVLTVQTPLAIHLRPGIVDTEISLTELCRANSINSVCLEIPTDCYRVHFLES